MCSEMPLTVRSLLGQMSRLSKKTHTHISRVSVYIEKLNSKNCGQKQKHYLRHLFNAWYSAELCFVVNYAQSLFIIYIISILQFIVMEMLWYWFSFCGMKRKQSLESAFLWTAHQHSFTVLYMLDNAIQQCDWICHEY